MSDEFENQEVMKMSLEMLTELSTNIGISPLAMLGYSLIVVSVIAISMSKQRHLLLFILAGMTYWLLVEIMQAGLSQVFPLSNWHAYVIAMMMGWLPMVAWVIHRGNQKHKDSFSYQLYQKHVHDKRFDVNDSENHIEHTPMYYDYRPKFQ